MPISPDAFSSALKKPIGGAPAPASKPAAGLDLDSLMGAPGGEDSEMDKEAPGGEQGETDLMQALEKAGYSPTEQQISQIKNILGDVGAMIPEAGMPMGGEMGSEDQALTAPAPSKPTSKLGKMLGK